MLITVCKAQMESTDLNKKIDAYVGTISERNGIPGAAVAVVKDGKILHKAYYGNANLEHDVPVTSKSIFRVYSLTKTVVATAVFQLLEQKQLSLEDKVAIYIDDIPEAWGDIQLKHLLTHSSGLPDMAPIMDFENLTEVEARDKVFGQPLRFQFGTRYDYNQTNFWLLQRIIEKVTEEKIEDFIFQGQFWDVTDSTVFLSSDSRDIVSHRVTPYFPFRNGKLIIDNSYLQGRYMLSANGLNLTLEDYIQWNAKFEQNQLIGQATKDNMFKLFAYIEADKAFAYGWDSRELNGHASYGFSGSLVTAYRIFPEDNMSIIFLSNGLEHYYDIENVINHLASFVNEDIYDANNEVFEDLLAKAIDRNTDEMLNHYRVLKDDSHFETVNFESILNNIGYVLLRLEHPKKALKVFELNTNEYPNSWNVWDSLAEGHEHLGDTKNAIHNYEKSLILNPDNKHAVERLKALRAK